MQKDVDQNLFLLKIEIIILSFFRMEIKNFVQFQKLIFLLVVNRMHFFQFSD